ncbi:MAG: RNA polymerase sigma factor [Ardenticatenaceae bacterium]|nr:RNA polymerase sigma factor [Ardenticatenaceae bacterium]
MLPEYESSELYAGCLSEETAVCNEAYRVLWHILYRVAFAMMHGNEMVAEGYAQKSIERVFSKIDSCESPDKFVAWAQRLTRNLILDELRREKRLVEWEDGYDPPEPNGSLEMQVLSAISVEEWRNLLLQAPLSDRSQRVVIGRFLDDEEDEQLSQIESDLSQTEVRPNHIQATRSKNLSKLKAYLIESAGKDRVG